MARLLRQLPRLIAATAVWLLLTAAITYAAAPSGAPVAHPAKPVKAAPTTLVVPDVRGQVFVFAKGMLEDAGFAWKVSGAVQGYAANRVAAQVPAPGTRVVDNGQPTIRLVLAHGTYAQVGTPQNASPFAGTKLRIAEGS